MDTFALVLFGGLIFLATLNVASLGWAFYLDRRLRQKPVPKTYDVHVEGSKVFKEAELDEVEKEAVDELHEIVRSAGDALRTSLNDSVSKVSGAVEQRMQEVAGKHFVDYQNVLSKSLEENQKAMSDLEKQVDDKRLKLNELLKASMKKEYDVKMALFEQRMSDVVASYIVDSLNTGADVSAQVEAIVESLEKNKEEIKRDIAA